MQKPLMIVIAAGFLIAVIFMFLNRSGPCEGIFEQTAPSLSVKVAALKANGEWAIGPEKVQDVSEGAQKIAVHLKSCCISQQSGYMKPEQYQVCVNGAKEYDAKIIQITNIIKEADTAKQQGNTQVAEQKVAEAKATVDASTNIERDLGKLAEAAKKVSPAGNAKPYFFFDFKGKTLGDQWEVIRPDKENYALEKDGLSIINSKAGGLADDNIPNVFRLKTPMPEGDWTATVKISSEFPAINESIFLALLDSKEHWIAANLYPDWSNIYQFQALFVGLSTKSAADSPSTALPWIDSYHAATLML